MSKKTENTKTLSRKELAEQISNLCGTSDVKLQSEKLARRMVVTFVRHSRTAKEMKEYRAVSFLAITQGTVAQRAMVAKSIASYKTKLVGELEIDGRPATDEEKRQEQRTYTKTLENMLTKHIEATGEGYKYSQTSKGEGADKVYTVKFNKVSVAEVEESKARNDSSGDKAAKAKKAQEAKTKKEQIAANSRNENKSGEGKSKIVTGMGKLSDEQTAKDTVSAILEAIARLRGEDLQAAIAECKVAVKAEKAEIKAKAAQERKVARAALEAKRDKKAAAAAKKRASVKSETIKEVQAEQDMQAAAAAKLEAARQEKRAAQLQARAAK